MTQPTPIKGRCGVCDWPTDRLPCPYCEAVAREKRAEQLPRPGHGDPGTCRDEMGENDPAALALSDQWLAEVTDVARSLASNRLGAQEIALTEDERGLLEAGYAVGFAATLLVLERAGWLRKP